MSESQWLREDELTDEEREAMDEEWLTEFEDRADAWRKGDYQ